MASRRSKAPSPGAPDTLSPARLLRELAADSPSQRVGASGPVANPEVSFPGGRRGGRQPSPPPRSTRGRKGAGDAKKRAGRPARPG